MTECSLYVIVLKEMNPTGFYCRFLVLSDFYSSQLTLSFIILTCFPKVSALHCDIFKSNISLFWSCNWTEWNVPCSNAEVTDNVETERGCLRVRASQQPGCVFKHRGQYKRSSLTATQSPPGISAETIPLPARLQWGSSNTGPARITFLHLHRGEQGSVSWIIQNAFVSFINRMTSTFCWGHSCNWPFTNRCPS